MESHLLSIFRLEIFLPLGLGLKIPNSAVQKKKGCFPIGKAALWLLWALPDLKSGSKGNWIYNPCSD